MDTDAHRWELGASHHYHQGLGGTPSPPLEERAGERRPHIGIGSFLVALECTNPSPLVPLPASGERESPFAHAMVVVSRCAHKCMESVKEIVISDAGLHYCLEQS
jgi:hypothetical protein